MLPRGGRITIRTTNVTLDARTAAHQAPDLAAGNYVLLEFSDQGHGMSEEVKSRIFEPFFTTKGEVTGLGLSVSYNFVAEHKGRLEVESKPGEGTCFSMYLPVC